MNKNGFKKKLTSNSTLMASSINQNTSNYLSNSNINQNNPNFSYFSNLENLVEDSDFFVSSAVNGRQGKIIHQTTEHSIDKKGNHVLKIKTIRELNQNSIKNNKDKKIKIITKNKSHQNYINLNYPIYKNSNKELYSSPDFFEASPNNNEIISPVEHVQNYSSGSEYEDYPMKSFDVKDKKNLIKKKFSNIQKINYELEDPEGFDYLNKNGMKRIKKGRNVSRGNKNIKKKKLSQIILNKSEYYNTHKLINNSYQSDFFDFQSPDRDLNMQNKFRKITENMLDSKGPTNNDNKITKSIKNKMLFENKNKIKSHINKNNKNNLNQIEAAKIIQAWWRNKNKYMEREVYDITVKNAIKLQSFIRGFLIRKKVFRYITLALYYQTFCDKIQDALYSNIKRRIFNMLKTLKKIKIKKSSTYMTTNILSNNNSRSFLSSIGCRSPQTYLSNLTFINNNSNENYCNYSQYINNNYNYNHRNRNVLRKCNYINTEKENEAMNGMRCKIWKNCNKNNIVENCETVTTTRRIIQPIIKRKKYKNNKNEIMSGGTLSIIKLPNRKINYSESEEIYKYSIKKEKNKKILIKNNSIKENIKKSDSNNIYEKIIIREELKPETAEDGNNRQIFDMKISKNVKLKIPASFETKRITKKEIKEIEIIKKREKEKNKEIAKYKKYFKKVKNDNKLNKLKQAIKIVEYRKKIILKKYFEKFKNNIALNKDKKYEIELANDIQIKQKEKSKEKIKNTFNKLLITENRSVSFNGKIKDNKKNIIISNDKLNIISDIKKEELGLQIGQWKTKIEKNETNNLNIIKQKSELINTGIQYIPEENTITNSKLNIITNISKEDVKEEKKWNPTISKINNDINIINIPPIKVEEASQYLNTKNTIDKKEEITIVQKRAKLVDSEIQHEPPDNYITKSKFDIISKISKSDECSQIDKIILNNNNNEISKINTEINIKVSKPEKVDECTQYVKIENIIGKTKEYKIIQKTKSFTEKGIQPDKTENKITKSKLNIISHKSPQKGKILINEWNPIISRNNSSINILPSKPNLKSNKKNIISQIPNINIIHSKPKLINEEIQIEPEINYIDNNKLQIEFKSNKTKPQYKDSVTQYEEINKETKEEGINTLNKEKIEIKIRTVKRSIHKIEIPLLKKIWLRKAFRTFKSNCKRPLYHEIIKKELLRIFLLKWRFIKGYGPDRYGNIYDRNGVLLYKTEGKVTDEEIQQEFNSEKEEQSTQYTPIENVISTLKQMEIKRVYERKKEKEKVEIAVGNDLIIGEKIQRIGELIINRKEKEKIENIIDNNTNIEIKHIKKKLKDESTGLDINTLENKIINLEKINISNEKYLLQKKMNFRKKTLLTQMIYKKAINEKLIICDSLHHWLKQSLLLKQKMENDVKIQKRKNVKITKNEQFYLFDEIEKKENGTQIEKENNKIENIEGIKIINLVQKKDSETSVDFPNKFEKINPDNKINISFKYKKKIPLLKIKKENNVHIYSNNNYISIKEIKLKKKKRLNEILYKYFTLKETSKNSLRKYFTIWRRNVNYLTLMENAQIITDFCKKNLNKMNTYRKWKKICEKLIIKERIKIIKKTTIVFKRKNKLFDLIRLTRIYSIYAKRRYLHYILLSWLAFVKNISQKKQQIKMLYENILKSYINMADDVFGNKKEENPSVQDALYEVMVSNKYNIKNEKNDKDVPLAEDYYKSKKEIKKIETNITYINNNTLTSKNFIPTGFNERKNAHLEKKVVKIGENERLHSKGRGRKYRTKEEKEILNKFRNYSYGKENLSMNLKENININSIKIENEDNSNINKEINTKNEKDKQSNSFFI